MSVSCSLVITCWERVDLLALLCVRLSCVFVTNPYGALGQMLYLIVSFLISAFFTTSKCRNKFFFIVVCCKYVMLILYIRVDKKERQLYLI